MTAVERKRATFKDFGRTRNFDPEKRINIRFNYEWTDILGQGKMNKYQILQYIQENQVSSVYYMKGFLFIPAEYLVVRYSRRNFKNVPLNLLGVIVKNMRNTKLDEGQIYHMASIMASVRLMQKPRVIFTKFVWLRYVQNYLQFVKDLTDLNGEIVYNQQKAYEDLLTNAETRVVILPYRNDDLHEDGHTWPAINKLNMDSRYGCIQDLKPTFPEELEVILAEITTRLNNFEKGIDEAETKEELIKFYETQDPGFLVDKPYFDDNEWQDNIAIREVYHCPREWPHILVNKLIIAKFYAHETFEVDDLFEENIPLESLKRILKRFSRLRFWDTSSVTIDNLNVYYQEGEIKNYNIPDTTSHEIAVYTNKFNLEKKIAKKLYKEGVKLSRALGLGNFPNFYYSSYFIKELADYRRDCVFMEDETFVLTPEDCVPTDYKKGLDLCHPHYQCELLEGMIPTGLGKITDPQPSTSSQESDEKSYFKRLIDTVTQPFQQMRDSLNESRNKFDTANETVKDVMKKISTKLDSSGFSSVATSFAAFDASSISSGMSSIKNMINSLFEQVVRWFYNIFGFDVEIRFSATDLALVYLLWINTDCKIVKTAIIGYLAAQMGILDAIMGVCSNVWEKIKVWRDQTTTTGYEEVMAKNKNLAKIYRQQLTKKQEDIPEEKEETEQEEKSMMEYIMGALEEGTPVILGMLTVGVAGIFAYKAASSYDNIGMKVVNFARNMLFIGGGLGAIGLIMKHTIAILKVANDYVKTYVMKKESTTINKVKRVVQFLNEATYIPGTSNYVFARDVTAAVGFMEHFAQLTSLDKDVRDVTDVNLRTQYYQKRKDMVNMYNGVRAILQTAMAGSEVFHVQFYSKAGAGKTDLSRRTVSDLTTKIKEVKKSLDPNFKGMEYDDSVYYTTEGAKYHDLYHGQKSSIIDEMNCFDAEELDTIQFKLGLFSGVPTVANKAAIEDKGMLFDLDVVISNTNNQFPRPTGVVDPAALWRRRILVEAIVKPEFVGANGLIDQDKIVAAGVNRTKSEHLIFNVKDPMIEEGKILDELESLTYDELIEYLKSAVENHILTEQIRLSDKAGHFALLKNKMEQLITTVERQTVCTETLKELKLQMLSLAKKYKRDEFVDFANRESYEKAIRDSSLLAKKVFGDCQQAIERFYEARVDSGIVEHPVPGECVAECGNCRYCAYQIVKDTKALLENFDLLQYLPYMEGNSKLTFKMDDILKNTGFSYQNTNIFMTKLTKQVHNGEEYWGLEDGATYCEPRQVSYYRNDPANYVMREVDGQKRILYKGHVDQEDEIHLLGTLRLIEGQGSHRMAVTEVNKLKQAIRAQLLEHSIKDRLIEASKRMYESLQNVISNTIAKLVDVLSAGMVSAVVAFGAIFGIFGGLWTLGKILNPDREVNTSYNSNIRKNNKSGGGMIYTSLAAQDSESDLLKKSQVILVKLDEQGNFYDWVNASCIQGSVFMTVAHFSWSFEENVKSEVWILDPMLIKNSVDQGIHKTMMKGSDFYPLENKDAALFVIPKFRALVSIKKKFITEEDLGEDKVNFSTFQSIYQGYVPPRNLKKMKQVEFKRQNKLDFFRTEPSAAQPEAGYPHRFIYTGKSSILGGSGQSGALAIHLNSKMQSRTLVGMVTGMKKLTYYPIGFFITQEDIDVVLKEFSAEDKYVVTSYEGEDLSPTHPLYDVFDHKETLKKAEKDRSISETSGFTKTPIFGTFPAETEPAILNAQDRRIQPGARHPLKVSLNKSNGEFPPYISEEEEKFMIKALISHYEKQNEGVIRTLRIYDTSQAIRGTREEGSVPINIHSSAGLPYSERPGVSGKQPYITYNELEEAYNIKQEVFDDVELYELCYSQGVIPPNLKLEFIKKELVGPNKIENPKTRTVGTGNFIQQIIYNKRTRGIQNMLKNSWKHGNFTSFAIGLDMEVHAKVLMDGLRWKDYMFDFDVKAWESAINQQLMMMSNKAMNTLLDKAYQSRGQKTKYNYHLITQGLLIDYTHAHVQFKDVVYTKRSGLLSGHPGTFIENSNIHVMLLYLIIRRILEREGKLGYMNSSDIYNNVRFVVAGDDVLLAVSPLFRQFLTPESLQWGYSSVGFEITSADKTPDIRVKNSKQVQFLKHEFQELKNLPYAAQPLTSIIYQLFNWRRTDTKLAGDELLIQNYEDAFRFSFFRGEQYYEEVRAKFNEANLNKGIQQNLNFHEMAAKLKQQREEEDFLLKSRNLDLRARTEGFTADIYEN